MYALLLAVALSAPDASIGPPGSSNLLRRALVRSSEGVPDVARMADGVAPVDGDVWNGPYTAVMNARAAVEWEFPEPVTIRALRLQADNNDVYRVSTSMDGVTFTQVWTAGPVGVPGLQTRTSEELAVTARFLRLTGEGGDNLYSVGELEAYATAEERSTATLRRIVPPPPPPPPPVNTAHLVVLAVGALGAFLLYRARQDNLLQRSRQANAPLTTPPQPGVRDR